MSGHRDPYVGEGADGCRRSADIDRAEADTYPTGSPGWQRCLDSAQRWEAQAADLQPGCERCGGGPVVDEAAGLCADCCACERCGGGPVVDEAAWLCADCCAYNDGRVVL